MPGPPGAGDWKEHARALVMAGWPRVVALSADERSISVLSLASGAGGVQASLDLQLDPEERLSRRRACLTVVEYLRVLVEAADPTLPMRPPPSTPPPPSQPPPEPAPAIAQEQDPVGRADANATNRSDRLDLRPPGARAARGSGTTGFRHVGTAGGHLKSCGTSRCLHAWPSRARSVKLMGLGSSPVGSTSACGFRGRDGLHTCFARPRTMAQSGGSPSQSNRADESQLGSTTADRTPSRPRELRGRQHPGRPSGAANLPRSKARGIGWSRQRTV